ncbi:MAG: peptidylprolyl isomerase [Clostridia bacterium]|nr:peptidylprolyl isomerase [Clostridia bacterium]
MGKGQRVRAERAAEKEANKIAEAKRAKKQKITKVAVTVISIVLIVCLVGGLVYNAVYSAAFRKGTIQRDTVVLETENYSVDAAMMSYFFYSQYNNFLNTYSSYLEALGLDTSVSLKTQDCTFESGSSWFDYFANQAGSEVKEYLYLAEKAQEEKMTLSDDDQADIQATIDQLYSVAEENKIENAKFLSAVFGTGVNESDVRKCLELQKMALNYLNKFQDSLSYTDAELEQYYTDNIDTYRYVDYYSFTIAAEDTKDTTTYAAAKTQADALAAVKDAAAFSAWVENYLRANKTISDDYTEDELKSEVSAVAVTKALYNDEDSASEWLFKTAKVGETFIYDDETGSYTVYLCTATPYRDESATRTIRDIVLTESTYSEDEIQQKATDILNEMKAAGLTEETFKKYAAEYSENTSSSANGGLCENYKESSFEGNIGAWAYSSNRKVGDFEAIEIDGGYAICYYVGEGIAAWKSDCISDKKNADYEAAYEEWTKAISLEENEKGYSKIPNNV